MPAVLVTGATATQNSPPSSLAVAVTIASAHCAYPRMDVQAELAWVAGYVVRQSSIPVLIGLNVEQLRWSRPTCYRYTKPPPFLHPLGDRPKLSMSFLSQSHQVFGRPLLSNSFNLSRYTTSWPSHGIIFSLSSSVSIYYIQHNNLSAMQVYIVWFRATNFGRIKNHGGKIPYVVHLLVSLITMGEPRNDNGLKAKWVIYV